MLGDTLMTTIAGVERTIFLFDFHSSSGIISTSIDIISSLSTLTSLATILKLEVLLVPFGSTLKISPSNV